MKFFDYKFIDVHKMRIKISRRNAMEFVMKKDYHDNWKSEMHEKFCFWTYQDWINEMIKSEFHISSSSHSFTNHWIVENRLKGNVEFYDLNSNPIEFPVTHMILIGEKKVLV